MAVGAALVVLLLSSRALAFVYTDYLWFKNLRATDVFTGMIRTKVLLGALFTLVAFGFLFINLYISDRFAPKYVPSTPQDANLERLRDGIGRRPVLFRAGVALGFGLMAGLPAVGAWKEWLLFRNGGSFGIADPTFGKDVGFYVFDIPFYKFLVDWTFGAVALALFLVVATHYVNGGIRIQPGQPRGATSAVKVHVSVLMVLLAASKAAAYWVQKYELTISKRGFVTGASYTDIKAQLPAFELLIWVSVIASVLFLANIRRRGWSLPIVAVVLWSFTSFVVGVVYPAAVQQFRVNPSESAKEAPYIAANIDMTRTAYGLDGVVNSAFDYQTNLASSDLETNASTLANARLWDPSDQVTLKVFTQQQAVKGFYKFNDIDVDRYEVDGAIKEVLVSARELNIAGIPEASWENQHVRYTHGYSPVAISASAVSEKNLPEYLVKDLPPTGELTGEARKGIYFGEGLSGYALVRSTKPEIDYQLDGDNQRIETRYDGVGGVKLDSFWRKLGFALRFGDQNLLISDYLAKDSSVIYRRDITERLRAVAPFFSYDADPYLVMLKDRLVWVVDAYSTTDRFPYSESAPDRLLSRDSGLKGKSYNYVRNSVKAVVDAYDGTVTLYRIDDTDPIAAAWAKAFPSLFANGSKMSDELRSHLRYAEDLFRVQTDMYRLYHVSDPAQFYDHGDEWEVAADPGSGQVSDAIKTTTTRLPMEPYYLLMKLPGAEKESFVLIQPMTPRQKDTLVSFMVAKSDPGEYGEIEVYEMPRSQSVAGPTQVDGYIQRNQEISQAISLLGQSGSQVVQGNLLLLPVDNSVLYVRPLYTQGRDSQIPQLWRVVVVYGDTVASDTNLEGALAKLFSGVPQDTGDPTTLITNPPEDPTASNSGDDPVAKALEALTLADQALRSGNLAEYQNLVDQAREYLRQVAPELVSSGSTTSASSGATTTSLVDTSSG